MANCVCTVYSDLAAFHTAVEAIDDTKFLGVFTYTEAGTTNPKIVLVVKT